MSTDQLTEFKDRLRAALDMRADGQTLLAIVRDHYASGGTKSEAYETLQEIWQEHGYDADDHSHPDATRDTLESVLERVWYWGA